MDGSIPTSLPFPAGAPSVGGRAAPALAAHEPLSVAETLAARRADSVELSASTLLTPASTSKPDRVSRLVAASVDVPVHFDTPRPAAGPAGALPMYRHPADRNIAATGVTLGRRVDVTG